jgi:hypothetical protein
MKEALGSSEMSVLQEPRGVTSQKTPFLIVQPLHTIWWFLDFVAIALAM